MKLEDRMECTSSNQVSYKKHDEMLLTLPIPLENATNIGKSESNYAVVVRPNITSVWILSDFSILTLLQ